MIRIARPIKDGVDYFPKDTDFYMDDKVRILRAEFGAKGMYLLDYILCEIYRTNGYYLKWDDYRCFLVSDGAGCGCTPDTIREVVAGCCRCSLFDERVRNAFGVLTSAGIQRRYIRMFGGRENIYLRREYWLLDMDNEKDVPAGVRRKLILIGDKTSENPDKTSENPDKTSENCLKERKEKQNKTKQNNLFVSERMHSAFESWIAYSAERGMTYTPTGLRTLIDELKAEIGKRGENAVADAINHSMARGWRSIYYKDKADHDKKPASYDIDRAQRELETTVPEVKKKGMKKICEVGKS